MRQTEPQDRLGRKQWRGERLPPLMSRLENPKEGMMQANSSSRTIESPWQWLTATLARKRVFSIQMGLRVVVLALALALIMGATGSWQICLLLVSVVAWSRIRLNALQARLDGLATKLHRVGEIVPAEVIRIESSIRNSQSLQAKTREKEFKALETAHNKSLAGLAERMRSEIDRTLSKTLPDLLPQVITLRDLNPSGCFFETTCRIEMKRIRSLGHEEDFIRLFLAEVTPEDTVFDIGACVGLFAIHTAVLGIRTVAFEPDPGFRSRLESNLRLNALSKDVQVVDWAVSDEEGEAALFTDGVAGLSPALRATQNQHNSIKVRTRAIDRALQEQELPYPTVVKLDIEGAEMLALKGMRQTLTSEQAPRVIFIELHPGFLPTFGSSVEEVEQLLYESGYDQDYNEIRNGQIHRRYRKRAL